MPGIDYSKWDKLEVSDSENDSEYSRDSDDDEVPQLPRSTPSAVEAVQQHGNMSVTRLAQGSSVTIGGSGGGAKFTPPAAPVVPSQQVQKTKSGTITNDDDGDDLDDDDFFVLAFTRNGDGQRAVQLEDLRAEAKQIVKGADDATGLNFLWGQTKHNARLGFILPNDDIRGKDIHRFEVAERSIAFQVEKGKLLGQQEAATDLVKLTFPLQYSVKDDEQYVDGCWEIKTLPSREWRLLVVQLEKASVGQGVYLWWDRALAADSALGKLEKPIDVKAIPDRVNAPGELERAEAFKKSWDEAHQMFREKREQEKAAAESRRRLLDEDD